MPRPPASFRPARRSAHERRQRNGPEGCRGRTARSPGQAVPAGGSLGCRPARVLGRGTSHAGDSRCRPGSGAAQLLFADLRSLRCLGLRDRRAARRPRQGRVDPDARKGDARRRDHGDAPGEPVRAGPARAQAHPDRGRHRDHASPVADGPAGPHPPALRIALRGPFPCGSRGASPAARGAPCLPACLRRGNAHGPGRDPVGPARSAATSIPAARSGWLPPWQNRPRAWAGR